MPVSKLHRIWHLVKETALEGRRDHLTLFAAGFSYFILFSLIPLMIAVLTVAGKIVESHDARSLLMGQLAAFFDADAARSFLDVFQTANRAEIAKSGFIGSLLVLYGASRVFSVLQRAISQIWDKEEKRRGGIKGAVAMRIRSALLMIIPVILVLAAFVVEAMVTSIRHRFESYGFILNYRWILAILSQVFSLGLFAAVFSLINRLLPMRKPAWKDVWFGALVTTVAFALARFLFTSVFRLSHVSALFGGVGAVILVLMWIYFSMLIFLYGSELTRVYVRRRQIDNPAREHFTTNLA